MNIQKEIIISNIQANQDELKRIDFKLTRKEKHLVYFNWLDELSLRELDRIDMKIEKIGNKYNTNIYI